MKYVLVQIVFLCVISSCFGGVVKRQSTEISNCRTPDPKRSIGRCQPISTCRTMISFLNNVENIGSVAAQILRQYACESSTPDDIWVCCPFKPIKIITSRLMEEPSVDHSNHPNIALLPSKCGVVTSAGKIIDGNPAALYEFPWAAAIKFQGGESKDFLCGGSLINTRYILTAAHCLREPGKELIGVRLGDINFNTNPDCEMYGTQTRFCAPEHQDFDVSISDAIVHPNYDRESLQYDIALIRLRKEADTTQFAVEPICLPITIAQKDKKMDTYTVIGWGATTNQTSSDILLKAEIPAQGRLNCSYSNPTGKELSSRQLCAGGKSQAVCGGDSGGPLMAEYIENGIIDYLQYGILSFGPKPCKLEDFPATYTRVASYMDWILDNLQP